MSRRFWCWSSSGERSTVRRGRVRRDHLPKTIEQYDTRPGTGSRPVMNFRRFGGGVGVVRMPQSDSRPGSDQNIISDATSAPGYQFVLLSKLCVFDLSCTFLFLFVCMFVVHWNGR